MTRTYLVERHWRDSPDVWDIVPDTQTTDRAVAIAHYKRLSATRYAGKPGGVWTYRLVEVTKTVLEVV